MCEADIKNNKHIRIEINEHKKKNNKTHEKHKGEEHTPRISKRMTHR